MNISVDDIIENAMDKLDRKMSNMDRHMEKFDDDMLKFDREFSRVSRKHFNKLDPRYETEKAAKIIKKQISIMKIVNYGILVIVALLFMKLGFEFYGYITDSTFEPKPLSPITEQVKDDLKKL